MILRRTIAKAAAVLLQTAPVLAEPPNAHDAAFDTVRSALAEAGTVVEYAPNIHGEIASRRATLDSGRGGCEWVLTIEDRTILRRVSAPLYRSTETLPLAALDPESVAARPLAERPWCCARSADVVFAAAERRAVILRRAGASWSLSAQGRLIFADAGAARRAAMALAAAIRACRSPGA